MTGLADALQPDLEQMLPTVREHYIDLHSHPELSMQEHRTAEIIARRLDNAGYEVTRGVGGTGVVGVLRNGTGPTVALRADMDALPVREETGLPYSSTTTGTAEDGATTPVAHACGHDIHVAWLVAALALLAARQDTWSGTVVAVFQPGEETAAGARAMVADGLAERFPTPDIVLAQHVMPARAGTLTVPRGVVTSASDVWRVRIHGRGAHGSMPEAAIDPVVIAASAVLRLQTVVSRETAMSDPAVLTVGSLHAGSKENVIPDEAVLGLNMRSYTSPVRERMQAAVRRIINAEADAAGATQPPDILSVETYDSVENEPQAAERVESALTDHFGPESLATPEPTSASEDFGELGRAWGIPSVYWFVGGTDADTYDTARRDGRLSELPTNHHPAFAPTLDPTLRTGVATMLAAASAWLAPAK